MSALSVWSNWFDRRRILREMKEQQRLTRSSELVSLVNDAHVALRYNDRDTAIDIWERLRTGYSGEELSSRETFELLLSLERFDDAENLMSEGALRSPKEVFFAKGLAFVAMRRGDFGVATERWSDVRKRFPGELSAYVDAAGCLILLKRYGEAEEMLELGISRFPNNPSCLIGYARFADDQTNWPVARERWRAVLDTAQEPNDTLYQLGLRGIARSLIELGEFDEAEQCLNKLLVVQPGDPSVRIQLAGIAEKKGNFDEAADLWDDIQLRFPSQEEAQQRARKNSDSPGVEPRSDLPEGG